ncbi:hypothetical protein ABIA16_003722 [Sinorhizobium fredii]
MTEAAIESKATVASSLILWLDWMSDGGHWRELIGEPPKRCRRTKRLARRTAMPMICSLAQQRAMCIAAPLCARLCGSNAELLKALDAHGDAHAAADARPGKRPAASSRRARVEDAGARSADRMADRDRAAIDVDDRGSQPRSLLTAQAWARTPPFASTSSTSSTAQSAFSSALRDAGTGLGWR